jgi:TATA-binding protein-associated factor Taf7
MLRPGQIPGVRPAHASVGQRASKVRLRRVRVPAREHHSAAGGTEQSEGAGRELAV